MPPRFDIANHIKLLQVLAVKGARENQHFLSQIIRAAFGNFSRLILTQCAPDFRQTMSFTD
jgi:hypothetical protein